MVTRMHVYNLGSNKIQFSYAHGINFLLVGGHYDDDAKRRLQREMDIANIKTVSSIFIPEWTEAYCGDGSLFGQLLEDVVPTHVIIPAWNSDKQFASRIRSHVQEFKRKNPFVDIQNVYNDFLRHDTDTPSQSNNNIVILSQVENDREKAIYAYRFESSGKWTTINLESNNYDNNLLQSDIVVFPTLDDLVLQKMDKIAKVLNANVHIKYMRIAGFWSNILTRQLEYYVDNNDVVVTRNDSSPVACYYFNPSDKGITNKREYYV